MHSTSMEAFRSLSVGTLREEILELIEAYGEDGCISDDLLSHFPTEDRQSSSTITSRFSELEREGLIFRNGDTRPGRTGRQQKVMRHIKYREMVLDVPIDKGKKRSPFVKGVIFAAKIVAASSDFGEAKKKLAIELKKLL